jgi:transposase
MNANSTKSADSTKSANSTNQLFVGIDIAATTATAAWLTSNTANQANPSNPFTFDQTPSGFGLLMKKLKAAGAPAGIGAGPQDTLVVMEATSTYWIMLASTLHEAGYRVSVINPTQAHHFAKALLKRAKTDQLDAQTLACLAQTLQPEPWTPPPAIYHELQQRLALRDSLVNILGQLRNQLHALQHNVVVIPSVRSHMQDLIHDIESQIRTLDAELKAVVQQDKEWGPSIVRLQSIKGIGLLTASWLVVSTLNFSSCDNVSKLCSYMGLAPMPRQSGSSVRGRPSIGHSGKKRARTALYMATMSAARHNPAVRSLYERLRGAGKPNAGKPNKVARCAAARKLLIIAWAVAKKGTNFDPNYATYQSYGHKGKGNQPPKVGLAQPLGVGSP